MKHKLLTILTTVFLSIGIFAASPGALDSSFGVAGTVVTDVAGNDNLQHITLLPDGKIVAVGRNISEDFVVVRYTANGELDQSFSGDGRRNINFSNGVDSVEKVCVQSDNKIVVFGFTEINAVRSIAVARLTPNGSNDLSFSNDGINTYSFGTIPTSCSIQNDGKIIFTLAAVNGAFATVRLNSNGSLDSTFGNNGLVNTTVSGTSLRTNGAIVQPDGKIITFGTRKFSFTESVIIRYNTNGSLDTTFSGDGIALFNFAANNESLTSVKLQSSEKIILGISQAADAGGVTSVKIARLLSNGTLDTSFGSSGIAVIDVPGSIADALEEIFVESDESILVMADRVNAPPNNAIVSLDGGNGAITTKYGANGFSPFFSADTNSYYSLLGDKLVVGDNSGQDFRMRRINLSKTPSMPADFDGDGVSDTAVFRPSAGMWFVLRSSDNTTVFKPFGVNGDIPTEGDFDGDGRSDFAIFRPAQSTWFVEKSSDGSNFARSFGNSTDSPVVNDYDKDGKTDIAIFRPSNGNWFFLKSSSDFNQIHSFPFGDNGDIPIGKNGF